MNINDIQKLNEQRAKKWHNGQPDWSLLEWAGAMCGEAGEAANLAKKIKRLETTLPNKEAGLEVTNLDGLKLKLASECADTIIYALLLMSELQIDADFIIARVFNKKSEEYGFPERL